MLGGQSLLALLFCLFVTSLHGATTAKQLETYRQWHDACLAGSVETIDSKISKFEKQLAANPADSLARAFLGSACALRAKAGRWGPTKLKFLKRGRQLMEEAVTSDPTDARVRMVRAIAYYRIPERFGVRETAINDFKSLIPLAKNPKSGLKINERQVLLFYASQAFEEEKIQGAQELRRICHNLNPKSSYGRKAR